MDNTSLKHFVNRIPLLKYRYIGSFPSDLVPNLPNDTFAIIITQPSNTPGEHWIMFANFHHELYFADSLGLSINNYPFLKQNYSQMVRTRLQDHPSVCGFYTIYATFHSFKLTSSNFTTIFLHSSITKKVMASGTPSVQVRIPVGDPIFRPPPPPPLLLTLYYLGENLSGGGKIMRRQNNYPAAE